MRPHVGHMEAMRPHGASCGYNFAIYSIFPGSRVQGPGGVQNQFTHPTPTPDTATGSSEGEEVALSGYTRF